MKIVVRHRRSFRGGLARNEARREFRCASGKDRLLGRSLRCATRSAPRITNTGGNCRIVDGARPRWLHVDNVTCSGAGDASGLAAGNTFSVSPTDIMFGLVTAANPVIKSWTGTFGAFKETLTAVTSVDRTSPDAITWDLTGTVTGGVFHDAPATMQFSLTQAGGPGNVVSASLTNSVSNVPEPSTWVMMALGFAGLGYAAVRRNSKDRSALAI